MKCRYRAAVLMRDEEPPVGGGPLKPPFIFSVKVDTSSGPSHNTSGFPGLHLLSLRRWRRVGESAQPQQQHSCVWYSVGGIHGSALTTHGSSALSPIHCGVLQFGHPSASQRPCRGLQHLCSPPQSCLKCA